MGYGMGDAAFAGEAYSESKKRINKKIREIKRVKGSVDTIYGLELALECLEEAKKVTGEG